MLSFLISEWPRIGSTPASETLFSCRTVIDSLRSWQTFLIFPTEFSDSIFGTELCIRWSFNGHACFNDHPVWAVYSTGYCNMRKVISTKSFTSVIGFEHVVWDMLSTVLSNFFSDRRQEICFEVWRGISRLVGHAIEFGVIKQWVF